MWSFFETNSSFSGIPFDREHFNSGSSGNLRWLIVPLIKSSKHDIKCALDFAKQYEIESMCILCEISISNSYQPIMFIANI